MIQMGGTNGSLMLGLDGASLIRFVDCVAVDDEVARKKACCKFVQSLTQWARSCLKKVANIGPCQIAE